MCAHLSGHVEVVLVLSDDASLELSANGYGYWSSSKAIASRHKALVAVAGSTFAGSYSGFLQSRYIPLRLYLRVRVEYYVRCFLNCALSCRF